MRRPRRPAVMMLVLAAAAAAAAVVAGACSGDAGAPAWTYAAGIRTPAPPASATAPPTVPPAAPGPVQPSASVSPPAAAPVYLSLTILSDTMTGKIGWPVFLHSDFTLPTNSTVIVTVTNFDNATPVPNGAGGLAQARGIVGDSFTVTPINAFDPNGSAGPTTTKTALDPTQVSHTFSIGALGLNVPIAPNARTTFTIRTDGPCACYWHCLIPCGTAPNGYGGPMSAASGYMEGTLTVS